MEQSKKDVDTTAKDVSIVDDDVLEVFELVEDNTIEECMMLVNKLSENSLLEVEKEKENLTRLLKEADKEVSKLKKSLRSANSSNEKITLELKTEKQKTKELEEQLKSANERLAQIEDDLTQSKDEYLEIEDKYQEASKLAKDTNHLLNQVLSKKNRLEKEVDSYKKQQSQFAAMERKMQREQERANVKLTEYSEKLLKTEAELQEKSSELSTLEEDFKLQIEHLQEKLNIEKGLNRSLAVEADECVAAIGKKFDSLEKQNSDTEKEKSSAIKNLTRAQHEMTCFKEEVEKERIINDQKLKEAENTIEELRKSLHTESLKCALQRKDQADLELSIKNLQNEKCVQENQILELQQSYNEAKCELASYEERMAKMESEANQALQAANYDDGNSWANRVSQEEENESYEELKHRNEVLRQNNELRYQAQMAVVQLASTNRRFVQHMEQLKMQLGVAEKVYQEKLFECNLLEIQVQHLMHQINAANGGQIVQQQG
ncbi:hypothetical protein AC249_AIPGENE15089 [Exaiptasia diaphana]|nr:hypothetical protein AC249_AIPGENE15089 [Exaiptasia diaphana]